MHYLITGHTGFKGSWLAQLLVAQGHEVSGVSLDPKENDLFTIAKLEELFTHDFRQDIRNYDALEKIIKRINPEVLIHFAAQPLVLESYRDPVGTYETNVNGTLNVLRASENITSIKARLIITTDKVYRNSGQKMGYVETDSLGGLDPYSASKAMADILAQSWSTSTIGAPIAIARAGNVIGGGDFAKDRILADAVTSFIGEKTLELRNPGSVRPWQHVLDCLSGYLNITNSMLEGPVSTIWNIGPEPGSYRTVREILSIAENYWGKELVIVEGESKFVETDFLTLDSSKAAEILGWKGTWDIDLTMKQTIDWYKQYSGGMNPRTLCEKDISVYLDASHAEFTGMEVEE
jgi:CDP-glucose 4,6-dehydratase